LYQIAYERRGGSGKQRVKPVESVRKVGGGGDQEWNGPKVDSTVSRLSALGVLALHHRVHKHLGVNLGVEARGNVAWVHFNGANLWRMWHIMSPKG
jgi:hypothetical protein